MTLFALARHALSLCARRCWFYLAAAGAISGAGVGVALIAHASLGVTVPAGLLFSALLAAVV
ncbi:MAG: hypothetical protein ACREP1_03360, partial [Rhodanobacteraceae bacterium]